MRNGLTLFGLLSNLSYIHSMAEADAAPMDERPPEDPTLDIQVNIMWMIFYVLH